jgi:hypothetical protein
MDPSVVHLTVEILSGIAMIHLSFPIPEGLDMADILEKSEFFIEDGEEFSIARYKESDLLPIV